MMNKDILNTICVYLDIHNFHKLKDDLNLSVIYYCSNTQTHLNIYLASSYGYLDVVKYLYNLRNIGNDCINCAITNASENGHLDMVKYLHRLYLNLNLNEYCKDDAMNKASENGHLKVVKYLYDIGKIYTDKTIKLASVNGHLKVVKYLCEINNVKKHKQ